MTDKPVLFSSVPISVRSRRDGGFQVLAWLGAGTGHRWLLVTALIGYGLATLKRQHARETHWLLTAAFGLGYGLITYREPTCTSRRPEALGARLY